MFCSGAILCELTNLGAACCGVVCLCSSLLALSVSCCRVVTAPSDCQKRSISDLIERRTVLLQLVQLLQVSINQGKRCFLRAIYDNERVKEEDECDEENAHNLHYNIHGVVLIQIIFIEMAVRGAIQCSCELQGLVCSKVQRKTTNMKRVVDKD